MYWPKLARNLNGWDDMVNEMSKTFSRQPFRQPAWDGSPKLNAWTKKDAAIITAEVPGVKSDKLKVSAYENKLTIEGAFTGRQKGKDEVYHRCECSSGKFRRELALPFKIDASKVMATCKNGILQVTVSRVEEDKPKVITVKSA